MPARLLKQAGDDVDGHSKDDGTKEVRQQRVTENRTSDRAGLYIGIGHLEGHANGERDIREILVVGRVPIVLEIDASER